MKVLRPPAVVFGRLGSGVVPRTSRFSRRETTARTQTSCVSVRGEFSYQAENTPWSQEHSGADASLMLAEARGSTHILRKACLVDSGLEELNVAERRGLKGTGEEPCRGVSWTSARSGYRHRFPDNPRLLVVTSEVLKREREKAQPVGNPARPGHQSPDSGGGEGGCREGTIPC